MEMKLASCREKNEDQKQVSLAWIISNTLMFIAKETQYPIPNTLMLNIQN